MPAQKRTQKLHLIRNYQNPTTFTTDPKKAPHKKCEAFCDRAGAHFDRLSVNFLPQTKLE